MNFAALILGRMVAASNCRIAGRCMTSMPLSTPIARCLAASGSDPHALLRGPLSSFTSSIHRQLLPLHRRRPRYIQQVPKPKKPRRAWRPPPPMQMQRPPKRQLPKGKALLLTLSQRAPDFPRREVIWPDPTTVTNAQVVEAGVKNYEVTRLVNYELKS